MLVLANCAEWFTGADSRFSAEWCESLVDFVIRSAGERDYCDRQLVATKLRKAPPIRHLFGKRKRIFIAARVFETLGQTDKEWPVPEIRSIEDLCGLLEISIRTLDWLCLPHIRRESPTDHYRRRAIRRKSGQTRWIESPMPVLKRVQQRILQHVLNSIPVHRRAFAYRKGLSASDCAQQHAGHKVLLKMDLADFFGSIHRGRVISLFLNAGYSKEIANYLTFLTTASALRCEDSATSSLNRTRLPQGAPTSPALANIIGFRLDRRLAGLASSMNGIYSRYSDDLFFSGGPEFARRIACIKNSIAAIVLEEGFQLQYRKTRVISQAASQRLLGLTVNTHPNVPRAEYDNLRALLFNCANQGWRSQVRDLETDMKAHLLGKIGYVASTSPTRALRLRKLFNQIEWD